ncbi:hypothetical protein TIFTF001_054987, partial [Ficus carica]
MEGEQPAELVGGKSKLAAFLALSPVTNLLKNPATTKLQKPGFLAWLFLLGDFLATGLLGQQ